MTAKSEAIGYVRQDVSGARQQWDEIQMRSLARRLGYNLRKTIVFGPNTHDPVGRLRDVVGRLGVDAVIVPGVAHFDGLLPIDLLGVVDLVTVAPEERFARWKSGELTVADIIQGQGID
ncbi:hypothetical protein [Nocardia transvalensis]|uniref:hypothetical protein n=1 Tax=Nocardia transvalensis TaxID=37333 RepID=UPI0002E745F9|nr:hypothetical protein [Nocardia transvalensis]